VLRRRTTTMIGKRVLACGVTALVLGATVWACGSDEDEGVEPSADGGASSSSSGAQVGPNGVVLRAAFDLPQPSASTLSALVYDGSTIYALPDREPLLVQLTPSADFTSFTFAPGPALTGVPGPWDGEGLAKAADGSFYVVTNETVPTVGHVAADGTWIEAVEVPAHYADQPNNNKGFESLSLSPSGQRLFTCNENALVRDGLAPTKTAGSPVRLLEIDLATGEPREYAYLTDPLGPGGAGDMGVSEVLAVAEDRLLVLERGFQPEYGNTVRVYSVRLAGATDVLERDPLGEAPPFVTKELVVDVSQVPAGAATHPDVQPNPLLDNYEGMTLGPRDAEGHPTLVLLSDDNEHTNQVARVLVLSVPNL
jgi:hypothetical protein